MQSNIKFDLECLNKLCYNMLDFDKILMIERGYYESYYYYWSSICN